MVEMVEDEIENLILYLHKLKKEKSPFLTSIDNFGLLISTLSELKSLIEMKEIKKSIVSQIKFLLINESKSFDGHMLHTVLSGGPGTGKTEVGIILAKIWKALGLIDNLKEEKKLVVKPIKMFEKNEESSEGDEITLDDLPDDLHVPNFKPITPKNTKITNTPNTGNTPNTPNNTGYSSEIDSSLDKIINLEKKIKKLSKSGKFKNNVVKKLQEYIKEVKDKLKEIKQEANFNLYQIKSLKREIDNYYTLNFIDEIILKYSSIIQNIENILNSSSQEESVNFTVELVNKNSIEKELDLLIDEISPNSKDPVKKEEIEDKDLIRIVSREDFVAGYLGQSALKTEKLLNESLGKVLFIDEAYSLVSDDKDSYGKEVLTTLNRFMSENSSKIVVIFAGYKELLDSTIFTYQPGLRRRCSWFFHIKGYSAEGLSQIFKSQLKKNDWSITEDINLISFFQENIKEFPHFGGDTLRLTFYCKICYSKEVFDNEYPNNKIINKDILNCALCYLKENRIKGNEIDFSSHNMYI
jgi:hypothetical protein